MRDNLHLEAEREDVFDLFESELLKAERTLLKVCVCLGLVAVVVLVLA